MRKFRALLFAIIAILISQVSIAKAAQEPFYVIINEKYAAVYDVNLVINNENIDSTFKTFSYNNRTFVPVRLVAEKLNATVDWEQSTMSAIIKKDGQTIKLTNGSNIANVNGKNVKLRPDQVPMLATYIDSETKTMAPLRAISELLGYKVNYYHDTRAVTIDMPENNFNGATISKIERVGSKDSEKGRIVADKKLDYSYNFDKDHNEVVIDFKNTQIDIDGKTNGNKKLNGKIIKSYSYGVNPDNNSSRITIELNRSVVPQIDSPDDNILNISFIDEITGIRQTIQDGKVSILVENAANLDYNIQKLENPYRYIIDIKNSKLTNGDTMQVYDFDLGFVKTVRASNFNPDSTYNKDDSIVRVVLDGKTNDINGDVEFKKVGNDLVLIPTDTKGKVDESKAKEVPVLDNKSGEKKASVEKTVEKVSTRTTPYKRSDVIILVDPGHGGKDSGSKSDKGDLEKTQNIDIGLRVIEKLKAEGYTVIPTRTKDNYVSLQDRAKLANEKNAHIFFSIHANSSPTSVPNGIETLYAPRDTVSIKNDVQYPLAKAVHDEVIAATGLFDRGVKQRPDLYVLKKTEMPAALIELGFLSNDDDVEIIKTERFKEDSANAIVRGINKYINKTYGL